jgi:hypothetical protein
MIVADFVQHSARPGEQNAPGFNRESVSNSIPCNSLLKRRLSHAPWQTACSSQGSAPASAEEIHRLGEV